MLPQMQSWHSKARRPSDQQCQCPQISTCFFNLRGIAMGRSCLHACRVCPHGMTALQYIVRKVMALESLQNWLAIRVSYGLNGVVLRNNDLTTLVTHLR